MNIAGKDYVEAIGRNTGEDLQHSHLYVLLQQPSDVAAATGMGACSGYIPMCRFGWNRSDGASFSIFRGHSGRRGLCKTCFKRAEAGLPPVESKPGSRKTKWI